MEDRYGHRISYLRVSITDRCNERCRYCLPEELQTWLPRTGVLSYEELLRVVRVAVSLGVRKVRVTGGEPLTRRDVGWFFKQLGEIENLEQIGVSTNGTLLAQAPRGAGTDDAATYAEVLKRCGVDTVNISLDSLDAERYHETTGRDYLGRAVAGIDAAREAGFQSIRLNTVLMRGQNEHEFWDLVDFAAERDLLLRFIELMPVSSQHVLDEANFLSVGEARRLIEYRHGSLAPEPDFRTNGPAIYYRVPGREQRIGFIGAMSNLHFCETCNKLRLTCEGKLRPCLGSHLEFDLLPVLRDPSADDESLRGVFREVVDRKPKEHEFRDNYQPGRRMIAIGG